MKSLTDRNAVCSMGYTWFDEQRRVDHYTAKILFNVSQTGDLKAKEMVMKYAYGGSSANQMNEYLDKTREARIESALAVYGD